MCAHFCFLVFVLGRFKETDSAMASIRAKATLRGKVSPPSFDGESALNEEKILLEACAKHNLRATVKFVMGFLEATCLLNGFVVERGGGRQPPGVGRQRYQVGRRRVGRPVAQDVLDTAVVSGVGVRRRQPQQRRADVDVLPHASGVRPARTRKTAPAFCATFVLLCTVYAKFCKVTLTK